MATWIEPKTNWTWEDEFTYADYNRMKNNLIFLNDQFNIQFPDPYIIDLGPDKSLPSNDGTLRKQDYYYASEFEAFEDCIDHFIRTGKAYTYGERGHYRPNGPFITPDQRNRIERLSAMYKNMDIDVTSLVISGLDYFLAEDSDLGEFTTSYIAIIEPYEARYSMVTWSTSDPEVATIDSMGECTIQGLGVVTIYAESDGITASHQLTVSRRATGVSVTIDKNPIEEGDTAQITVSVQPVGALYRVDYATDTPSVATVDANGEVTGVGSGNAIITVRTYQGEELIDQRTIEMQVIGHVIQPTSIWLTPNSFRLGVSEQQLVTLHYTPANATISSVVWIVGGAVVRPTLPSSFTYDGTEHDVTAGLNPYDNSGVGIIEKITETNDDVLIGGVAEGNAIVKVVVNGELTAISNVTVYVAATNIIIDVADMTVAVGETKTIPYTLVPPNATDTPTFTSSDTSVVTVDQNGNITGVASGDATITVSINGITKTLPVTTKTNVTGITLDKHSINLYYNASEQITATVTPVTATDKRVTWSSSDTSIATVVDGLVTSNAVTGTVTITAMTEDGGYTDTCTVSVTMEIVTPTSVSIYPHSFTTARGTTTLLTATVTPANAVINDIRWSVNNANFDIVSFTTDDPYTCGVSGTAVGSSNITVDVNNYENQYGTELGTYSDRSSTASTYTMECENGVFTFVKPSTSNNITVALSASAFQTTAGSSYLVAVDILEGDAQLNSYVNFSSNSTSDRLNITSAESHYEVVIAPNVTTSSNNIRWTFMRQQASVFKFTVSVKEVLAPIYIGGGVSDTATGMCVSTFSLPSTSYSAVGYTTGINCEDKSSFPYATWSSSDTSIVTVDSEGNLTGVAVGTATVTAVIAGTTTSTTVTVFQPQSEYPLPFTSSSQTTSGVTIVSDTQGNFTLNGTATANLEVKVSFSSPSSKPALSTSKYYLLTYESTDASVKASYSTIRTVGSGSNLYACPIAFKGTTNNYFSSVSCVFGAGTVFNNVTLTMHMYTS